MHRGQSYDQTTKKNAVCKSAGIYMVFVNGVKTILCATVCFGFLITIGCAYNAIEYSIEYILDLVCSDPRRGILI